MSGAYLEIARVLRGARRRQIRIVLLSAAGLGAVAAFLCLFAGALALAAGARTPYRALALAGAAIAILGSIGWAVRALLQSAWSDSAAARAVSAGEPSLRSALLSSVELARARPQIEAAGQLSVALVDGHLERTAERTRTLDLARALPDGAARRAGLVLLGVAAVHAVAFLVGGEALGRAYARVLLGDPPGAAPLVADPITGDIELSYRYPAYMRREPRTLSGTGGEIRAPKGTEVLLKTRADRVVATAQLVVDRAGEAGAAARAAPAAKRYGLAVAGGRDLSGRIVVEDGGSYRFRFEDQKRRLLAEGPPIPITIEPDAFPEVRITAPERELEVSPDEVVEISWEAEDDVGLGDVTLVLTPPGGEEQRRLVRRGDPVRRDGGTYPLPLGPMKLGEGERLTYRLEALDGDTVSGPKAGASDTHTIRIYSEAEHRRQVLERAGKVFEELIAVLGDRLDLLAQGSVATPERLPLAQALDGRVRGLHLHLLEAAREIRRDPAGPREVAAALQNVSGAVRIAEQRASAARLPVAQAHRVRVRPDRSLLAAMGQADAVLDRELEKGILYLEQLLDKRRAEDLVRLAKELAGKRRDLASLLEKYRKAPSEQAKQELLAQVQRMKERVRDLLSRMAELSKGFNDEHMNAEALAELARSQDLAGGLDEVEKKLAQGDVEGAMKALDQMASAMDRMLAGLQRTAGRPDEKSQALMREMLAFKEQLEKVERAQQRAAGETERIRADYRRKTAERMKGAAAELERLRELAEGARKNVEGAQPGVTLRAQPDFEVAQDGLRDLERALAMRELDGAAEAVQRAQPSVERLSIILEEDASLGERTQAFTGREPAKVDQAHRGASEAVPKVREIRDRLSAMFPDPRAVLSQEQQKRLGELAERQSGLEQQAGALQEKLAELAQQAPVFPPSAQQQLGESRGHMGQAAEELGARNPQRGHGQQELALDALARFRKGLEEATKQRGGGSGAGFPFPFAESGGEQGGDGLEPSREPVKIPGAEAHKVPEEFRKDLLEAMKQGAPERYRSDVQRYYEELVK